MIKLKRYGNNPILIPTKHPNESLLVFNPAVAIHDNKVKMLYRAQGKDMISRLGYAESSDGFTFTRRENWYYDGGGDEYEELGIEDPRMVEIEGTYYIVYTAASEIEGAEINPNWKEKVAKQIRVSASSTKDFVNFVDHHVIIPDMAAKNASLFPRKINNHFWLLYRNPKNETFFSPVDKLENCCNVSHFVFKERPGYWDCVRTGIGSPPIETELGWLIFYHGVDQNNVYRLGVLLLDLTDPRKVLYRSKEPILEPLESYETQGFIPNVVFTCGAVELNDQYFVYYGAADDKIALATISKQELLSEISST